MRYIVIIILLSFITIAVNAGIIIDGVFIDETTLDLDSPHDESNDINCYSCHVTHEHSGPALTRYDTINNLCQSCHYEAGPAPPAESHQNQDCAVCHNPHTQEQDETYGTTYGKLIRTEVQTPHSGVKVVKFIAPTGPNSFADGDTTYDGICEVCHTQTAYHRNDDTGDHTHNAATNCTQCHKHTNGFTGMGGGAHQVHISSDYGPKITTCESGDLGCHGTYSPPTFADGQSLTDTTVCNNCHSSDGVAKAKQYWSNPGSSEGAEGSWAVVEGEASFCGSCHDATPGNTEMDGSGSDAPNTIGDDSTYGFYVTGHGKTSGSYANLSWQDASATGNPAANKQCNACHEFTSQHFGNPNERLKSGYEDDDNNSNCKQCHPPGTDAVADPQFYTTYGAYQNSAHITQKCTACHDVHGAAGAYIAMTKEDKQNLCYQCHTDGVIQNNAISGAGLADDIQQAFGMAEKHDLGVSFTLDGKSYTLECVSCHNVHIITGKHWEVAQGVSPITRFTNNTEVWGDKTGEKMDDYAALGTGTGGWYYSVARGGIISFDQPAVYQPPKTEGGGWENHEFDGDVLPDYDTFCLDCHTYRMSPSNPPVNWGQGIPCTDSGVDPPDQRIECGAQHGLAPANKPYAWDPSSTFYGSSGNPDPIFNVPGVQRGRGAGQFMRWPYESADRNAGINFVMSCTDCHEAHGSNIGSMLRTNPNNGTGTTVWNTMCNNCHYYYGYQHAGMSCGSASCHEANSIHRIIHVTESGGTYLWTEPSRPTNTPEIASVEGVLDSNELTVTFTQGVWTNMNQTGALSPEDFLLTDVNNDNPKSITAVIHTPGDSTATIIMSAPLIFDDVYNDILATRGVSIWDSDGDPAGPWPVTITACPTAAVSFQLNEPPGSATTTDESGLLIGIVGNPAFAFQGGDGYFHGDEAEGTYIEFTNNDICLMSPRAVTIEARVRPTEVDRGVGDNTFNRIFERKNNILVTILNTDYRGDDIPERANKASIEIKYRTDDSVRHSCPDPQWPEDTYTGSDVAMHQISSDIDRWPIVDNHWYRIKVVFNSDKGPIYGTPVDIFIDDQGTNGDDSDENWTGYINATKTINESSSCKWGALPGDFIATLDRSYYIGANWKHDAQFFEGQIDWVTWSPVADYSGVDDLPNFGDYPTNVTATAGDGTVEISWDAMLGAISYNIYWATSPGVTRLSYVDRRLGATSPETINLTNGITYYFIVTAVYSEGESGPSREVSETPSP